MTRSAPRRKAGERVLRAVRPNVGIEMEYRRTLDKLVGEMHCSIVYWLKAAYRANPPEMAQDAPDASGFGEARSQSPARALQDAVKRLTRYWQRKFNEAAPKLADHFATATTERTDAAMRAILRDAGISVRFKMTREANDVMQATIAEQVGLIKSIASEHMTEVQGLVMRSVQTGRDLGQLAKDLEHRYHITKRRAATIARDQNNKATASMTRVRQQALGITEAVWVHSGGGKHPRPTHLQMNGKRYEVAKGMYDPAVKEFIRPGELINCRCVSKSVIPGFG